jgi:hypothetical protein
MNLIQLAQMDAFGKKQKVGRNAPCPCGSGKKFKKCHGDVPAQVPPNMSIPDPEALKIKLEQIAAFQKQRQQQQGFGKSIISTVVQDSRIVAVGNKIFHSRKWRTFHDFLFDYMKMLLGSDWGNTELKKPREERHPILNWYHDATVYMNANIKEPGKVHGAPTTGVVEAYMGLAYDLYSLEHNAKVQNILLNRLKNREQFYGAYYETHIAGALVPQRAHGKTIPEESSAIEMLGELVQVRHRIVHSRVWRDNAGTLNPGLYRTPRKFCRECCAIKIVASALSRVSSDR